MAETIEEIRDILTLTAKQCRFEKYSFSDINLFVILGIQNNEVVICRFLHSLLRPDNLYGTGIETLKQFLCQITGEACRYTDDDLRKARVEIEEQIEGKRRVDIAIFIGGDVYPIEVKITAEDRPAQLFDYFRHYENSDHKIDRIYYLTPNGWEPSEKSIQSADLLLPRNKIQCLSFQKDILQWLNKLIPTNSMCKLLIKQFKEVIKVMCAQTFNEEKILAALKLDESFQSTKLLMNILLMDKALLWEQIRDRYLHSCLELGSNYKLEKATEKDHKIDKHSLFSIKKKSTEETIAWICVDWNLYIACEHQVGENWKSEKGYYWRYISPSDTLDFPLQEKLPLRQINPDISDKDRIPLEKILEIIENACENRVLQNTVTMTTR